MKPHLPALSFKRRNSVSRSSFIGSCKKTFKRINNNNNNNNNYYYYYYYYYKITIYMKIKQFCAVSGNIYGT